MMGGITISIRKPEELSTANGRGPLLSASLFGALSLRIDILAEDESGVTLRLHMSGPAELLVGHHDALVDWTRGLDAGADPGFVPRDLLWFSISSKRYRASSLGLRDYSPITACLSPRSVSLAEGLVEERWSLRPPPPPEYVISIHWRGAWLHFNSSSTSTSTRRTPR